MDWIQQAWRLNLDAAVGLQMSPQALLDAGDRLISAYAVDIFTTAKSILHGSSYFILYGGIAHPTILL